MTAPRPRTGQHSNDTHSGLAGAVSTPNVGHIGRGAQCPAADVGSYFRTGHPLADTQIRHAGAVHISSAARSNAKPTVCPPPRPHTRKEQQGE